MRRIPVLTRRLGEYSRVAGAASFLLFATLSGGCAFGHKFHYTGAPPRIDASGQGTSGPITLSVTVHDQRKRVVAGKEDPTFVGELRSLYHIPYGVHTASGQPLATDLTTVLASAFDLKGFRAIPVMTTASETPDQVVKRVASAKADRGMIVTLLEWRTDTYFTTSAFYELTARVLGPDGSVLTEQRTSGKVDEIPGSAAEAFRQQLEPLINQPAVIEALTAPAASPVPATPVAIPAASPSSPPATSAKWRVFSYATGMTDRTALAEPMLTIEACRILRNALEPHHAGRILACEAEP